MRANQFKKQAASFAMIAVGMFALAFASVPLYNLFCKVTGYGGTTSEAAKLPERKGSRRIVIRFNADISSDLNWTFAPEQLRQTLVPGEQGLAFYIAENRSDAPIKGRAVYNVTPDKVGKYFSKIHCFCFEEQTLSAHEVVHMPVTYFIDPAIEDDKDMADVDTITLSYTFFPVKP